MEPIIELKGTNGIMYAYEDRIVISRKTLGGIAAFGIVGDKTYYYNSIQGIEYSGGLIRIIPKGNDNNSYNAINIPDIKKAQKDSNVLLLSMSKKKTAEKVCKIVTNKVNSIYSNSNTKNNNNSNADEIMKFKKLLDEGIITQEEFERKKQELLK